LNFIYKIAKKIIQLYFVAIFKNLKFLTGGIFFFYLKNL